MDGQKDYVDGTELWKKVLECYCDLVKGNAKSGGGWGTYIGLSVGWHG